MKVAVMGEALVTALRDAMSEAESDLERRFEDTARSLAEVALPPGDELVSGVLFGGAVMLVIRNAAGEVATYEAPGLPPSSVEFRTDGD